MRIALLFLPAVLVAGCSSAPDADALTPYPVTGKVLYDGKPAAGVVVTFLPSDAPMVPQIPHNPQGITKEDGTFTLTTFADGDGAPAGGYQIVLTWPGEKSANADHEAEDPDRLMGWYDGTHSTFSHRVKAGENNLPPLNLRKVLKPPSASRGVPGRN